MATTPGSDAPAPSLDRLIEVTLDETGLAAPTPEIEQ